MNLSSKRVAIAIGALVAAVLVLNLVARGLDDAVGGNEPTGEPGSSYATAESGLAAYVELLARYDNRVTRVRGDLGEVSVRPDATLMVVDPGPLSGDDIAALERFLRSGNRVVLAGASSIDARRIFPDAPALTNGTGEYTEIGSSLGSVRRVTADGAVAFDGSGAMVPLAGNGDRILAAETAAGAGEFVLVADASPFSNRLIADADNAAFAIELAGAERGRVVFAEGIHGHGSSRGLRALPSRWKLALVGIGIAGVVYAWARGRRLGPPDRPHRELPPARAQYVEAMAVSLERTREPAVALADLARATRERVERDGVSVSDNDRALLASPPATYADVVAFGRVAARIASGDPEGRIEP